MDKPPHNFENKLRDETSPYLLQHVNNPVAWYPWGEEAILRARNQDKPILLSIGYSSCHWCHVMMRESFCDPDVAATMNRLFVNIMIDKEERPDLDKAYQTAYQLMMGQPGGWPLTLFVSPQTLLPYFGGTYFPKEAPEGAMGFVLLLHKLNEIYYHDKERIRQQEVHIAAVLQIMMQFRPASIAPIAKDLLHKAEVALAREFDPAHGGFGNETKFPNCPCLDFLLESPDTMNRHMALTTLQSMAEGGIYDQLDGGFFRYSVDDAWEIPHFEKMLYDNGQLIGIYANAYNITSNELYKSIAIDTAAWLEHHLLDKTTNGFYTAFDADTEEQEGLYYLWDLNSIKDLLNDHEFASIKKYFHLNHKANFEHKWHLYINPEEKAPAMELLKGIKAKLLVQRETRIPPALDTLILTGWNALTIKGLSIAAKVLNDPHLSMLSKNCIEFIRNKMFVDGRLYATWQTGSPKILAFLDDYAFTLDAVLTFIDGDREHPYLPFCLQLADNLLQYFYDKENGGFYFTANDAEQIFFRPKSYTDDSIPSGNGIACLALIKLGNMMNNEEYLTAATRTVHAALAFLNEAPELHLNMCRAYSELQKE